jgi:hypothetical protein
MYRIKKLKSGQGTTKCCTAIEVCAVVKITYKTGAHERTKCVLLVSFYFYNGRHKVRYNGRILCARVAPA